LKGFTLQRSDALCSCFEGKSLTTESISADHSINAVKLDLIGPAIKDGPSKEHESSTGAKGRHAFTNALAKGVEKFTRLEQQADCR
jgi:hypothetical protein